MTKWTKERVIESIQTERRDLEKNLSLIADEEMLKSGVIGQWSVKDIMAHLFDWEQRFLGWYTAGLRGEIPETPAPGLKWNQLPILNQQVFEKHQNRELHDVRNEFQTSYDKTLKTVKSIREDDMFMRGRYEWTKRDTLAGFILANTASHYRWAKVRIRRWMKTVGIL